MNKQSYLIFAICLGFMTGFTQTSEKVKTTQEIIKPIAIDKTALSGLDLKPVTNSAQPERKLFQKNLYIGSDIGVFVVSSETADADWDNYSIDEFIYVINGRARLHPRNGEEQFFYPGEFFMVPKGYTGIWETQGGTEFYHELSVIALNRPKARVDAMQLPLAMDKVKISGQNLTKITTVDASENYQDILIEGIEIDVHLEAETATIKEITTRLREQLIYVIAGSLSLTPTHGETQTFYAGDFLVLPANFVGKWESRGHHLFRSLRVMRSKKLD